MLDPTLQIIVNQYDLNLAYAQKLVEDVSAEQMTALPTIGLVNHPAFTLGHLVSGAALLAEDLGAPLVMPVGWDLLFLRKGPGDPRLPDTDTSKYPAKEILLEELKQQHDKVKSILLALDNTKLKHNFNWRFSAYLPTLLDMICFMCINHEAMHLGQLAAWRREMNLPSALAKL